MTGPRAGLGGMTGAALLVVGTYCLGTIAVITTMCACVLLEKPIPDPLDELIGVMVAGVGLLLAKTWAERPAGATEEAQPVSVVQPDGEPIPVAETPRRTRKRIAVDRAVSVGRSDADEQQAV